MSYLKNNKNSLKLLQNDDNFNKIIQIHNKYYNKKFNDFSENENFYKIFRDDITDLPNILIKIKNNFNFTWKNNIENIIDNFKKNQIFEKNGKKYNSYLKELKKFNTTEENLYNICKDIVELEKKLIQFKEEYEIKNKINELNKLKELKELKELLEKKKILVNDREINLEKIKRLNRLRKKTINSWSWSLLGKNKERKEMNQQEYYSQAMVILDNWETEEEVRQRIENRKNIKSALKKYNERIQDKEKEIYQKEKEINQKKKEKEEKENKFIKYLNIQTKTLDNLNDKIEKRNNIIQILFTDLNTLIDYVKKSFNSN